MLFVIFIAILIVGLIWYQKNEWSIGALATTMSGVLAVVISLFIIIGNNICADAFVDRMHVRYDTLVYQYENDIYDNDNDLGMRELMVNIQDWNEDLSYRQSLQDNIWLDIYDVDVYDQFKPIELK